MKQVLKLSGLFFFLLIQFIVKAQTTSEKRILVYFHSGVQRGAPPNQSTAYITSPNVLGVLNMYGLSLDSVKNAFPNFNEADTVLAEVGEVSRQMNWAKIFKISLPDTSFKTSLINALNGLPEVLYAESDGNATTNVIPVDGRFSQQWNMQNNIFLGADIHAAGAWDIFTGNPNAIIAVIDAGVDVNHNDLAPKILGGDGDFTVLNDPFVGPFSHGSHVAGIAAAVTNNTNNNGVAGVDWQARIHPRHVIANNTGDAGIANALRSSVNFSPNVWTFNNSWGLLTGNGDPGRYSVTVRSAFSYIYRNNRLSCTAMGNDRQFFPNIIAYPAGFNTGQLAVGATDINDQIAAFSNQGSHIDVSAPGVGIVSTNFNNDYIVLSGTSMATPHVSGLASLLKGFNTNLVNDDIESIIKLTADDLGTPGFDNVYGSGRINAERALQSLQAPNQLLHQSVTGGTIVNTSGTEQRVFLGFPGLADAVYFVRRSEVRTNVTFPAAMCTMVGAWGRGNGTTGYREEFGRCYGEGICEVVPGTLTNTGMTLRTWIYEVTSASGQYIGYYPKSANDVVFQYTILGVPLPSSIEGADAICSSEYYHLNIDAPAGTTVTWDASPSGIVTFSSATGNATTVTKQYDGSATLTATISNVCSASPVTIQRAIQAGPKPINIAGPYDPILHAVMSTTCLGKEYYYIAADPVMPDPQESYTWTLFPPFTSGNFPTMYSGSTIYITYQDLGMHTLRVAKSNACGSTYTDFVFNVQECYSAFKISTSPNPVQNIINVSIDSESGDVKNLDNNSNTVIELYSVNSVAKQKQWIFKNNQKKFSLNVAGLQKGINILRITKGKYQQSVKVILQ